MEGISKDYKGYKEYLKEAQRKGGKQYIYRLARAEAIKILIKNHRGEFIKLEKNLKKELEGFK